MGGLINSKQNSFNYRSVRKDGEILFYIAYSILLIKAILLVSTVKAYIPYDSVAFRYIPRLLAYFIIFAKLCLFDKFSPRKLYLLTAFTGLMLLSVLFNRYWSLIDIVALIVGSEGVPFKNIVRCYFKITSFLCVLFIAFSLLGIIENYVTIRGTIKRYAFGNIYATDFAAMVFYLQMCNAYLRKKVYSIFTVVFWVIVALLIYKFCDARLDFILILGFVFAMYLKAKAPEIFRIKIVKFVLIYGFALSCIVALLLNMLYTPESSFFASMNKLISGRLLLGKQGIDNYGFSLFGQQVEMQGWGWSNTEWNEELGYFFIDCGFLSVALRYGLVMLVIIVASFTVVAKKEIKSGNTVLPVIILFVGITSIIDHHFMELAYSPFIFLISYAISICGKSKNKTKYYGCSRATNIG